MQEELFIYKKGQTLFTKGSDSDCVYFIRKGSIGLFIGDKRRERPIKVLAEGDILGEMGLIDNKPRSATAVALKDCRVVVMKRMEFNYLTNHKNDFLVALIKTLTNRLRVTLMELKSKPKIQTPQAANS